MKTYAMTIDLKNDPEILALYEEYHSNVWPEVRQAVKKVGMENVRIFRFGTRLVQIFDARDDFDITRSGGQKMGYNDEWIPGSVEW